jgi:hypothetical protein
MIGSLERPPIVIRQSRGKSLFVALLCLALAGAGIWSLQHAPAYRPLSGWMAVIFLGVSAIIGLWRLVAPATLSISKDGLSYTERKRTTELRWREIETFRYTGWTWGDVGARLGLRPPAVTIEFSSFSSPKQLPVGWELDAEPLCELLNKARAQWGPGR